MRSAVALAVALVLAVLGQRSLTQEPSGVDGWLFYGGAVVLAVFAFAQHRDSVAQADPEPSRSSPRARLAAGLLALLALVANGYAVQRLWQRGYEPHLAWIWAGSLAAAVIAGWAWSGFRPPSRIIERIRRYARSNPLVPLWAEAAILLAIIAVAVFMRLYRLDRMPPGIFVDETNAAIDALHILEGRGDSPFGTGWFETPTMYAYYLLGLFKIVGINLAALKAASLIPALLTVAALYPLARHMFGIPTALASTFLLAVNRWHVNMSRWGWNEVAPPLFQIGATYFLLRGARRRHMGDFALGGLLLGLGMYTYLASRLVVVALAVYILYRIIVERGFLRRCWPGLVVFFLVWGMTFAPLATTYVRNPFTFWNRTRQVSVLNDVERAGNYEPVWDNVKAHLKMFHVTGDYNPRHNLPGEPMLDPITGALFLLGLGYSLFRLRDHRRGLLLLWILFALSGGVLSLRGEAPQGYRTLGVVPAIAILAGDALARAVAVFASLIRPRLWRVVPALLGAGVLGWMGWLNFDTYFHEQSTDLRVWQAFSPVETTVAKEVSAKQADHSLYLSHRLYYFSPLRFLTYQPIDEGGGGLQDRPYHLASPADDLPLADLSGNDALFLLDVHYEDLLELFTRYYPATTAEMVRGPHSEPLYLSVTVPGDEIVALHGLEGTYFRADDTDPARRRDAALDFAWPAALPSPAVPRRIEWAGGLRAPASGVYGLRTEGGLWVELDGLPVDDAGRFLGKGLHALRVVQETPLSAGGEVARLLWTVPGQGESIIPPEVLFAVSPSPGGLLGRYYQGEAWQGEPLFEQVSPLLLFAWPDEQPWYGSFSARWSGSIEAPHDGTYLFRVHADDGVRLWLDGEVVGEGLNPDNVNMAECSVHLSAGRHAIQVDYFQRGGGKALEMWWTVPGGKHQVVPPSALWPE